VKLPMNSVLRAQATDERQGFMKALIAGDREAFYGSEIAARESAGYPPFGRLASLVISSGDKHAAEGYARRLAAIAPLADAVRESRDGVAMGSTGSAALRDYADPVNGAPVGADGALLAPPPAHQSSVGRRRGHLRVLPDPSQ